MRLSQNRIVIFSIAGVAACALVALGYFFCKSQGHQNPSYLDPDDFIYATYQNKNIVAGDVRSSLKESLKELRRQEFFLKKQAVEDFIIAKQSRLTTKQGGLSQEGFTQFLKDRKIDRAKLSTKELREYEQNYKIFQNRLSQIESKKNIQWSLPVSFSEKGNRPTQSRVLPIWGNLKSKKQILLVTQFHCPLCRDANQKMLDLYRKHQSQMNFTARLTSQDPIDSLSSMTLRSWYCLAYQEKIQSKESLAIFQNLSENPPQSYEELNKSFASWIQQPDFVETCLRNEEILKAYRKEIQQTASLQLFNRPAFFVGEFQFDALEEDSILESVFSVLISEETFFSF